MEENIAAVKHANGRWWWILVHGAGNIGTQCSNKFYKFLLTEDGLSFYNDGDFGTTHCHQLASVGEMVFSNSGTMLAVAVTGQGIVDILGFDRCNGEFNSHKALTTVDLMFPLSCAFSKRDNYLYISGGDNINCCLGGLYQYDLRASNIAQSQQLIWQNTDNGLQLDQLQLAPDAKIYLTPSHLNTMLRDYKDSSLSVIKNPESAGLACDFQPFSFYFWEIVPAPH